jgi:3-hydroxybutyryl-CoA dehydrogenase
MVNSPDFIVAVVGAGAMGSGIAQLASTAGHQVIVCDNDPKSIEKAKEQMAKLFSRLQEKGKYSEKEASDIQKRISWVDKLEDLAPAKLVIEAIVERLDIKKEVFSKLDSIVDESCILASNTSSLSIASIASACKNNARVIGIHFFNPAPLMPLVEIIPGITTDEKLADKIMKLMESWGKTPVITKDTPGFIVNRVARPFYGEALRIYEEQWLGIPSGEAGIATIDWAMKEFGGFKMGPFELMDYIGNDVNYAVTESVFTAFYYDPRYRPSITQRRYSEAGWLGRKSGRGYYNYAADSIKAEPIKNEVIGRKIMNRIVAMLINEAIDAVYLHIASPKDIELAMTKGVNYPKGLLAWGKEIGYDVVLRELNYLQDEYVEDRYRPSPLLRKWAREGAKMDFN